MTKEMDEALAALAREPADRSLGAVEAQVWAAVRRQNASSPSASLRWAAVSAALGVGVLAGGVSAAADRGAPELAAFEVRSALAPSSLLDGRS